VEPQEQSPPNSVEAQIQRLDGILYHQGFIGSSGSVGVEGISYNPVTFTSSSVTYTSASTPNDTTNGRVTYFDSYGEIIPDLVEEEKYNIFDGFTLTAD